MKQSVKDPAQPAIGVYVIYGTHGKEKLEFSLMYMAEPHYSQGVEHGVARNTCTENSVN
jgi:hypothetical protein